MGDKHRGWIGVDLDKTLAYYDGWQGADHIGEPIPAMLARVKEWLAHGIEVRIFTARAYSDGKPKREVDKQVFLDAMKGWMLKHIGVELKVTCVKDFDMVQLWDDRAVQVIPNTGRIVS